MNALELRSGLKEFLDRIWDPGTLKQLWPLLEKAADQGELTDEMIRMAEVSAADIKAGRVYTRDEVEKWLDEEDGE